MLYLLATMERGAPAAMCEGWENSSGPDDPTDLLTANQYLYCQLSDNLQADIDAVQAAWDASRAANQAELAQKEQELATVRAQFEQQMALLNCPVPIVPYADITGDYATGITISCHDGYDLVGDGSSACTAFGTWSPALPTCALNNPCTADENDCSANAQCAQTGQGTHSCECTNDGDGVDDYYGSGESCLPCAVCGEGEVATAVCTSSQNGECTPIVCDALAAVDNGAISLSNGFSYPTDATYTCNSGLAPQDGDLVRSCQVDGSWTGTAPVCRGSGTYADPFTTMALPSNCQDYRPLGYSSDGFYEMSNGIRYCELSVDAPGCISQRWGEVCAVPWVDGESGWHMSCPDWTGCPAGSHMGGSLDFDQSPCASYDNMGSGLGAYTHDVYHFGEDYNSLCTGNWNNWGGSRCGGVSQCGMNGDWPNCDINVDFTFRDPNDRRSGARIVTGCQSRGSSCSRGNVCVQDW